MGVLESKRLHFRLLSSLAHPALWSKQQPIHDSPICCSFVPANCRVSTRQVPLYASAASMYEMWPHAIQAFGNQPLLHPKMISFSHYLALYIWSHLHSKAHCISGRRIHFQTQKHISYFLLKGNHLCATVAAFIFFYGLHFGRCSLLILHTLWKHLFHVSTSKGTVENKCVLLRAECGLLEPTQAGSC